MFSNFSKNKKSVLFGIFAVIVAVSIAGCNNGSPKVEGKTEKETTQQEVSKDPVTLKVFVNQALDEEYIDPVKKKYPNITLELITKGPGANSIEELIASGNVPDMMTASNGAILSYKDMGFLYDMTALAKKFNVDTNRFEGVIVNAFKDPSGNELYAMPYSTQYNELLYNKDIFDKFGVSYPSDGMTWDDAVDLAKKLTRMDGGTQYRGLDYEQIHRIAYPLSTDIVNAKTMRANVDNDTWRKIFKLGYDINAIPGNKPAKIDSGSDDAFFKTKNVAMYAIYNKFSKVKDAIDSGLHLGVAQYPSYKEAPNTFGRVDAKGVLIFGTSKYKDQSIQVIEAVTSDEAQLAAARKLAQQSPLKNPIMSEQFGADMPYLQGIDLKSIFKSKPAPAPVLTEYFDQGKKLVSEQYIQYVEGNKDLNTALRDADEAVNKMVAAEQAKKK